MVSDSGGRHIGYDTLTSWIVSLVADTDGPDTKVQHGGVGEQHSDKRQDLTFREKKSSGGRASTSGAWTCHVWG